MHVLRVTSSKIVKAVKDFISILGLILLLPTYPCSMASNSKAASTLISNFSVKFLNELDSRNSLVSSPLSLEYLLGLLGLCTTGLAHNELLSLLELDSEETIRSLFQEVSEKFKAIKGVTLNIANKVYLNDGPYELYSEIKQDALIVFDAEIEKVDFAKSEIAASLINQWVQKKTINKIQDLVSSADINAYTQVVLVNAIYFKGTWKKQFNQSYTQKQPFHINEKTTTEVEMMYKEDTLKYYDSDTWDAQFLELPYEGEEASMLIILPKEVEGLHKILEKFKQGHDLMSELEKMHSTKVQVSIPKFKIETEIDLKDILIRLGVKTIFDAHNSGITKMINASQNLYVSKAVQKAVIEVNEEGSEAAAASGIVIRTRRALEHLPIRFVCDRPALWCIQAGGRILLAARYQPPAPTLREEL